MIICKVIAVANQKGGVGKTVTCVNLGIGLAREGKRVLMIDADPQGSLTISLGYPEPDKMGNTLSTVLMNVINDEEFDPEEDLLHHAEGVDILPGNIELSGMEVSLIGVISRETILKAYVERVRAKYDYIIIDCIGLIERKKQGQGKPTIIYVKNFELGKSGSESQNVGFKTPKICESRISKDGTLDSQEMSPKENKYINTIQSDTESNLISSADTKRLDEIDVNAYAELIKENIELDILLDGREC